MRLPHIYEIVSHLEGVMEQTIVEDPNFQVECRRRDQKNNGVRPLELLGPDRILLSGIIMLNFIANQTHHVDASLEAI